MSNIQQFIDSGIYKLPYPQNLREKVLEALEAWKKFVSIDDSITDQFPYQQGVGYEHQRGGGPTADRKKDFHYTEDGADFLWSAAQAAPGELSSVSRELIEKAQGLVAYLGPTAHQFSSELGKAIGVEDFAQEVLASRGSWFLRFLYYPGDRTEGEYMAVPHIDKSAFTFHLYESDSGLQALPYGATEWIDTPVSDTETIIFPGFQMQFKSKGKIKALCHRVVAKPETTQKGRYSMVVFFSLKNTKKYDKSKGRLQDYEPGFNYDMTPEDVEKRFM